MSCGKIALALIFASPFWTLVTKPAKAPEKEEPKVDIDAIHSHLKIACDRYQDADGWVNISSAGGYLKRVMPDFDSKTYGFTKLTDLIKAFPKMYESKTYPGKGTVTIFAYRCQ